MHFTVGHGAAANIFQAYSTQNKARFVVMMHKVLASLFDTVDVVILKIGIVIR